MTPELSNIANRLRGKFIVVDGPEGCGKTSQVRRLFDSLIDVNIGSLQCKDPGYTGIGIEIRRILLEHDLSKMDVNCETMLFMAARAQLVAESIRPALARRETVLCERFVSSTCAYQGAGGYDPKRAIELARFAIGECWPDLTIILDIDVEEGFGRIGRKSHHSGKNRTIDGPMLIQDAQPDAMEARPVEFHRRVRRLFLELHEYYPRPVVTIDGRGDVDTVHLRVLECLAQRFQV